MLLWKILALEKCLVFKTNVYDGIVGVAYGKSNDKLPSIRKLFCFFCFCFCLLSIQIVYLCTTSDTDYHLYISDDEALS